MPFFIMPSARFMQQLGIRCNVLNKLMKMRVALLQKRRGGIGKLKAFIYINTILIPYHAAVVFAMAMSMVQAQTNHEIVVNLYWMVPVNFLLASIPNLILVLILLLQKKLTRLIAIFLKAELYVVVIQVTLHAGLLVLANYGPSI